MGIDQFIKNLSPKRKKLYETIITISLVVTLLYDGLTFIFTCSLNIYCFFMSSSFTISVVAIVTIAIVWKILHGGSIKPPEPPEKPKEYNIPNPFGIQSIRKEK